MATPLQNKRAKQASAERLHSDRVPVANAGRMQSSESKEHCPPQAHYGLMWRILEKSTDLLVNSRYDGELGLEPSSSLLR